VCTGFLHGYRKGDRWHFKGRSGDESLKSLKSLKSLYIVTLLHNCTRTSPVQQSVYCDFTAQVYEDTSCALPKAGAVTNFWIICDKRDLLYDKRDLLYDKRDLLYDKRDLLYDKRDAIQHESSTYQGDEFLNSQNIVTLLHKCTSTTVQ